MTTYTWTRERKISDYYKVKFVPKERKLIYEIDEQKINNIFIPPETVSMEVTKVCNFKCPYCYANSLYLNSSLNENNNNFLNINNFFDMLDNFITEKNFPLQVTLGGGEPSLHPNLYDLVKGLHDRKIAVSITTNGTLFSREDINQIIPYIAGISLSYHKKNFDELVNILSELNIIQKSIQIILPNKNIVKYVDNFYKKYINKIDFLVLLKFMAVGRAENKKQQECYSDRELFNLALYLMSRKDIIISTNLSNLLSKFNFVSTPQLPETHFIHMTTDLVFKRSSYETDGILYNAALSYEDLINKLFN